MWLNNDIKNRQLTLKEAQQNIQAAINRGRLSVAAGRFALDEMKANGYIIETTDDEGKKKTQTRTPVKTKQKSNTGRTIRGVKWVQ